MLRPAIIIGLALALLGTPPVRAQVAIESSGSVALGTVDANPPTSTTVNGDLTVTGGSTLGNVQINGFTTSAGGMSIAGNLRVNGNIGGFGTVPVGAVIDWWRPRGSNLMVPENFAICDGSPISDPDSPFNGSNTPNLVGNYIRGTNTYADIGKAGGAPAQNVNVTMNLPDVTGGIAATVPHIGSETFKVIARRVAGGQGEWRFQLVDQSGDPSPWNDGNHVHSMGQKISTDIVVPTEPPYIEMLKIVRIK